MARPNPAYNAEDKIIMRYRAFLEAHWLGVLTPTQRTHWLTRWTARPPRDIKLKSYVPYAPTRWDQVRVSEPAAYAWSQVYGYQRFHRLPIDDPAPIGDSTVTLSNFAPTTTSIPVDYNIAPPLTPPIPFIIWIASDQFLLTTTAGTPARAGSGLGRSGLRPMCFNLQATASGSLDSINCFKLRANADPGGTLSVSAGYVNDNNELVPSNDLLTQPVI